MQRLIGIGLLTTALTVGAVLLENLLVGMTAIQVALAWGAVALITVLGLVLIWESKGAVMADAEMGDDNTIYGNVPPRKMG